MQMDETTGILLRAGAKQPVDRRKAGTLSTKPSFLDGSSHSLIITRHGTAAEAAPVSRRTKGEKAQRQPHQWSGTHEPRARIACSCWLQIAQYVQCSEICSAVQCRTVPIYTYTYASSGWRIRRDERASASCCLVACLLQAAAGCPLRKGLAANRVPWSATRLAAPRLDFDCGYDSACAGGIGANGSGTTTKLATASSYQEPPWPRADGPSSSCLVLCRDSATQRGPNERT